MSNLDILRKIKNFEGKRNCVLTILIPPNYDFRKDTKRVRSKISGIKHKYKRRQLLRVMAVIWDEIKYVPKFIVNGIIICAGLNKHDRIDYYSLTPSKRIQSFEYYYDYIFNYNKINEYMYKNVITIQNEKVKDLIKNIDNFMKNDKIVYENKINEYIESDLIDTVIHMCDESVPEIFLEKSVNKNLKVNILDSHKIDNYIIKNNKYIGFLKYDFTVESINL